MKFPSFLRRFFAKRARAELPVVLDRKRIFILPTQFGFLFALLLFALLIGSINYNTNLGFFLTFLLASVGFVSIFHTYANLEGFEVTRIEAKEMFAGDPVAFMVACRCVSRPFREIRMGVVGSPSTDSGFRLEPGMSRTIRITGPQAVRGLWTLPRIDIRTTYPLGLFRTWSTLACSGTYVVFPQPAGDVSLLTHEISGDSSRDEGAGRRPGSDDFGGLRAYAPGDPMQRIAWKSSSRGTGLLTKEFVTGTRRQVALRWDDVRGTDEKRLSLLCAMVLAADRRNLPYRLEMPGYISEVRQGRSHRNRCLMRLAVYGMDQEGRR
ncbi:MAG: DUF58 domain-containing protein [Desulfoplanes sp.]